MKVQLLSPAPTDFLRGPAGASLFMVVRLEMECPYLDEVMTLSIDGRSLKPARKPDAYESSGIRIAAALLVVVPALLLLWLVYWIGSWTGGVWGGVGSVASTAVTVWALWMFRRHRRR